MQLFGISSMVDFLLTQNEGIDCVTNGQDADWNRLTKTYWRNAGFK
jgi:hypothetical protein